MLGSANKLKTPRQISMSGAVSGSGSFDGSGDVNIVTTQANIAVLTGSLPDDGESTEVKANYPTGFNRDNSVVIAVEGKRTFTGSEIYTTGTTFDSVTMARSGIPLAVSLTSSGITIRAKNIILTDGDTVLSRPIAEGSGFDYRIVLMKIS